MRETAVKCPFCGEKLKKVLKYRIKHKEECEKKWLAQADTSARTAEKK